MKHVDELAGVELDCWVAKALNPAEKVYQYGDEWGIRWRNKPPAYSKDWAHGGPIVEGAKIDLMHVEYRPAMGGKPSEPWNASMQRLSIDNPDWDSMSGTTALEAAMRAFVGSHFGAKVKADEPNKPAAQAPDAARLPGTNGSGVGE